MADEEIVTGETTPPEPETKPSQAADELRRSVKEAVTRLHGEGAIKQRVIDELVEIQISERVGLLHKALTKRDELLKKLNGIRPDQTLFNDRGDKMVEAFTKAKLEERRKAVEELAKADKAINSAMTNADYELVKKLLVV